MNQFALASGLGGHALDRAWVFDAPGKLQRWTATHGTTPPRIDEGVLKLVATGNDPLIVLEELLSIPVSVQHFVELRMKSDRPGRAELFWTDHRPGAAPRANHLDFGQHVPVAFEVAAGPRPVTYYLMPLWEGKLTGLRLDIPDNAQVAIQSIRIGH